MISCLLDIIAAIPYEDEGGGGMGFFDVEDLQLDTTGSPLSSLVQPLPSYDDDSDEGSSLVPQPASDPMLDAIAKREKEDYNDATTFEEKVVQNPITLTRSGSPYLIKQDVLITPKGTLNIEPGVTVRFQEAAGITVRGVLNADGKYRLLYIIL